MRYFLILTTQRYARSRRFCQEGSLVIEDPDKPYPLSYGTAG